MKKTLVLGAGGFIGSHLVKRLKKEGQYVIGVDLKFPEFSESLADEFYLGDLRDYTFVSQVITEGIDELYQLAADMGGAGYIFVGEHDADVMHNSAQINLNVAKVASAKKVKALFYSSSACMYPEYNQLDPENPKCGENTAYPAQPDSEYGWEKLFSERLYASFSRNYDLNVKIARFHNIYGEEGAWNNGKEKAPAALCRKIALVENDGIIDVWGDGKQTRSFLYIDDCLDAVIELIRSEFSGPYNIGSEEMVSIDEFVEVIAKVAGKSVKISHIEGPTGVRGRCSDNRLISHDLGWSPKINLERGISKLYRWIESNVKVESN
ncbi:NAD-dependent epimerase/dehydratase family protein [Wandonia haliotis]|uniref:NAD-dependent epimerase/dehydratase family protein n=1 Tax=Wandonia haliotis TaxID=574963 RepID=A0ABN1MU36_9FLAO